LHERIGAKLGECYMIIGSGLLAKAFAAEFADVPDVWIYAAGVSNSSCTDPREFSRERTRLSDAIRAGEGAEAFVYFSTCSIGDPAAVNSRYVIHKMEMERLVSEHANFVIVRMPQLAGRTPNPHTLLNYLHARVSRSEGFTVWTNATRNIIDIDDAAAIVTRLLNNSGARRVTVNVANPVSYPINDIVVVMEKVVGKRAITEQIEVGAAYEIDTSQIASIVRELGLVFGDRYIEHVMNKYYGDRHDS
jgi:nucleoside-diphosphate-sugar epimerase